MKKIIHSLFISLALIASSAATAAIDKTKATAHPLDWNGDGIGDGFFYQGRLDITLIPMDDILIPIVKKPAIYGEIQNNAGTVLKTFDASTNPNEAAMENNSIVHIADFNGDRIDDILLQSKSASGKIYLLFGSSYGLVQEWSNGYLGLDWTAGRVKIEVGDLNGDGRADIKLVSNTGSSVASGVSSTTNKTTTVLTNSTGTFTDISQVISKTSNETLNYNKANMAVGKVEGGFDVDPSGAANYSVSIAVPPGVGDMQPSLSLGYSSQGGNGIMGMGWSLGGLSTVHRCPQTYAQDGNNGGIKLDANDRLCMDGQRLVAASGAYGAAGTVYRTESDSFAKIIGHNNFNDANAFFEVKTKAGQTFFYGDVNNSRIVFNGKAFSWKVSTIKDVVTNTINFHYSGDITNGHFISSITYTGLTNGTATVNFGYEQRPDTTEGYLLGTKVNNTQRLKSITSSVGAQTVRTYQLYYESSPSTERSRLKNLLECGSDGQCKVPLEFAWREGGQTVPSEYDSAVSDTFQTIYGTAESRYCGDSISITSYGCGSDNDRTRIMYPDINGDGYSDLCYRNHTGFICALGTTTGLASVADSKVIKTGICADGAACAGEFSRSSYQFADMNGDGKADLLYRDENTGMVVHFSRVGPNGGSFSGAVQTGVFVNHSYGSFELNNYYTPDLNGDGRADMCIRDDIGFSDYAPNVQCAVNNNVIDLSLPDNQLSYTAFIAFDTGIAGSDCGAAYPNCDWDNLPGLQITDLNQDGKADIIYRSDDEGIRFYLGNAQGNGFGPAHATGLCSNATKNTVDCDVDVLNSRTFLLGDVNGDGVVDMCYSKGGGLTCVLGTGTDQVFDLSQRINTNICNIFEGSICNKNHIQLVDVNGDGKSDFVTREPSEGIKFWLSTGKGFVHNQTIAACKDGGNTYGCNDYNNHPTIGFADINGDGYLDLSFRGDNGIHTWLSNHIQTPDVLTGITDSMANQTTINYARLTDGGIYSTWNLTSLYPVHVIQAPMTVVANYSSSTGTGATATYNYDYAGLRVHTRGLGMLGFRYINKYDNLNKIRTQTWLDNYSGTTSADGGFPSLYPYQGMPRQVITYTNGIKVSDVVNTPSWYSTKSGRTPYFPYFLKSVEDNYDYPSGAHITKVTTDNVYDKNAAGAYLGQRHGNLTKVTIKTEDIASGDIFSKVTVNEYNQDDEDKWHLGRVTYTGVTHSGFGDSQTRETSFKYYDYSDYRDGLLEYSIEEPNMPNLYLKTSYDYDLNGNKNKVTVSGHAAALYLVQARVTESRVTYGASPQVISSNALQQEETKTLDPRFGSTISLVGPNNLETLWDYDGFSRKASESRVDGSSTNISYAWCETIGCPTDAANAIYAVTTTTSGSNPSTMYYDSLDRQVLKQSKDINGSTIYAKTTYNDKGQVTHISLPYYDDYPIITATHNIYDDIGRVTKQTDASGTIIVNTYTGLTSTTTTTRVSHNGNPSVDLKTTRENYANGKVSKITDAENGVTRYFYDAIGNLIETQSPGKLAGEAAHTAGDHVSIKMFYDKKGRKTSMDDPDMGHWEYAYNSLGELRQQTDAKGNIVDMAYDKLGRMTIRLEDEKDSASHKASTWEYYDIYTTTNRSMGKLKHVTGPIQLTLAQYTSLLTSATPVAEAQGIKDALALTVPPVYTYQRDYIYDDKGRSKTVTTTIDNVANQVDTTYGLYSRVSHVEYPENVKTTRFKVEYLYNTTGYLLQVRNAANVAEVFWRLGDGSGNTAGAYNVRGQMEQFTYGNNLTTTRSHNLNSGLVTDISSSNPFVQNNHYVYDSLGNLEQRSDANVTAYDGSGRFRESFKYDKLNRLASSTLYGRVAASGNIETIMQYHASGNIWSKNVKTNNGVGQPIYYQYNLANGVRPHAVNDITSDTAGLTSTLNDPYVYDANGNMQSGDNRGMSYTAFNKPYQIVRVVNGETKIVNFNYDADRSRYKQDSTAKTITYVRSGVRFEHEVNKATGEAQDVHYIQAGSLIIGTHVVKASGDELRYYHYDHLGSIAVITNAVGGIVKQMGYAAFGQRRNAFDWTKSAAVITVTETNYGFTGHEHIDDVGLIHMNGRAYDPAIGRFISADPNIQSPNNSQSYNRYSYVLNNPLSFTDPSGFFFKKIMKKFSGFMRKYGRTLVSVGMMFIPGMQAYAFQMGFMSGLIASGGDFKAALISGITAYAFKGVGIATKGASIPAKMFAHGMVGGMSSVMRGGKFGSGFISAAVGKGITEGMMPEAIGSFSQEAQGALVASIGGGIASELGGGKFKNGAVTAAMGYAFNRLGTGDGVQKKKSVEVDSTGEAIDHYMNGNGVDAELGPNTKKAIMDSEDQQYRLGRIKSGKTPSLNGHYGVNVESEGWDVYHVGDTPIHYSTNCNSSTCTTTFTSKGDGFWDPVYDSDGIGPKGEFGKPFRYKSFQWNETYPKPN